MQKVHICYNAMLVGFKFKKVKQPKSYVNKLVVVDNEITIVNEVDFIYTRSIIATMVTDFRQS